MATIEPDTRLSTAGTAEYISVDPERGIVLDAHAGTYYELNATGSVVWQALAEPKSLTELVALLAQEFDELSAGEVSAFVSDLAARGLVTTA